MTYAVAGHDFRLRHLPVEIPRPARETETVFDGAARVGMRDCHVLCRAAPGRDFLRISGAGAFAMSREEDVIEVDPEPGADEAAAVRRLLFGPGPGLWRRWVDAAKLERFLDTARTGGSGVSTLIFWRCMAAELWARRLLQ